MNIYIFISQSFCNSIQNLNKKEDNPNMNKRMVGTTLIILGLVIASVSAFVYEQAANTVTQNIVEVANITLDQGTLGDISEGETILYTATNTTSLDEIISITTTQANVYLHFDTDLDAQTSNYASYQIVVKAATVQGITINTGDTVATLTLASPDTSSGIDLDTAGAWTFDFEITTTADSVSSDTPTTVNIIVSAESTST